MVQFDVKSFHCMLKGSPRVHVWVVDLNVEPNVHILLDTRSIASLAAAAKWLIRGYLFPHGNKVEVGHRSFSPVAKSLFPKFVLRYTLS